MVEIINQLFNMGSCASSARQGPREPHLERASPEAIAAARDAAERAEAVGKSHNGTCIEWTCISCGQRDIGNRPESIKCHGCQEAAGSS